MKTIQYDLSQIDQVADQLLNAAVGVLAITLTGSLGAGKTTLVGALLRHLGVNEPVASPTFAYVNMYLLADGRTVYHFDLYRLKNIQEFEQAGFFDYLYQPNSLAIIEWPEILQPFLHYKVCHVDLVAIDQTQRRLQYEIKE